VAVRLLLALTVFLVPVAAPAGGTHRARLRPPAHGVQLRLSPVPVAPASEREVCQQVTVPGRRAFDVREVRVKVAAGRTFGSHHFAIFVPPGTAGGPADPIDSVGCVGLGGAFVSPILAFVQRVDQRIRFPRGVGLRVAPGQRLLLNAHWLNGGTAPVALDAAANLRAARPGTIEHHARSFQLGALRIDVPAGGTGETTATWTAPFPMNLVWLSTHSHEHTTSVSVEVLRGGVSDGEALRTTSYAEPAVRRYDTALRLEPGDALRWTCRYANRTERRLHFGVTSEDEMCFTVGFFYPDEDDAPLPAVPGCFGGSGGLVCLLG
jgi:copper type II ascorbate-dependent monooxygenase-like protein